MKTLYYSNKAIDTNKISKKQNFKVDKKSNTIINKIINNNITLSKLDIITNKK